MEQETMLKEILNALKAHEERISTEMKEGFKRVDERFEQVDERFDSLEKKFDGIRAEFNDTKEDVHYLLSKNAKHEEKLHQLTKQQ